MPQVFQVLKCYKCLVFQVHQAKKSNKLVCKMCGEKQSIKRHYGIGNGQECRMHVQKLNGIRGEIDESKSLEDIPSSDKDDHQPPPIKPKQRNQSKWSEFVEKEIVETTNVDKDKMFIEDTEVLLEVPKKKRQKRSDDSHRPYKGHPKSAPTDIIKQATNFDTQYISCSGSSDVINRFSSKHSVIDLEKEKHHKIGKLLDKTSNRPELQYEQYSERDNDGDNLSSQNKTKDLKIMKNSIKFVPPVINPNSKWAKFAVNDTNLSQTESEEENDPLNILEQHDEVDETFNLHNSHSNLIGNEINVDSITKFTIPTNINQNQCNVMKPTSDQIVLEEYDKEGNINDLDFNNKEENKSNLVLKSHNHSQKHLKGLFSLCDDNEIDEFLDI